MRTILFCFMLIFSSQLIGQVWSKYDSTMKIGKAGYRISCMNRSPDRNVLNVRPIGFKSESREATIELKARVLGAEIDDLNLDGFPDLIIFIEDAAGKKSIFPIASQDNERIAPILFPDIFNDMESSKGYRGKDEYKLVEGVLFRNFPVYPADTTIKVPTNKIRQLMYRVVKGERDSWKFKLFKQFDFTAN
ncbi:MAG: hypothetical protein WCG90_00255 [Chitinophagia bacterium]|jgi:hypothetical protein